MSLQRKFLLGSHALGLGRSEELPPSGPPSSGQEVRTAGTVNGGRRCSGRGGGREATYQAACDETAGLAIKGLFFSAYPSLLPFFLFFPSVPPE